MPVVAIVAADGEEKEGKIVTMILNDVYGTGYLMASDHPTNVIQRKGIYSRRVYTELSFPQLM
jgi:hypothetical protein